MSRIADPRRAVRSDVAVRCQTKWKRRQAGNEREVESQVEMVSLATTVGRPLNEHMRLTHGGTKGRQTVAGVGQELSRPVGIRVHRAKRDALQGCQVAAVQGGNKRTDGGRKRTGVSERVLVRMWRRWRWQLTKGPQRQTVEGRQPHPGVA
jgi:hypothetical protein